MVSLIFFSPVSKVSGHTDIAINTDMASCVTWLNDFSLQPQSEF
jgi:hypothetical protein